MSNFRLRDYQQRISSDGTQILHKHKILILNLEVRTGKTHIALEIGSNYNNVLFVTKKKAIDSIESDYDAASHNFNLTVINYESLHKIGGYYDLVICDESNEKISAYPKPTLNAKRVKEFVTNDLILLTGTLLPESNSQIYHQLWVSNYSPFAQFKNFYAFHKQLGIQAITYTSYGQSKDYSKMNYEVIEPYLKNIKISYTQKDAGFVSNIIEKIHSVDMNTQTYSLIKRLKKDLVIEGKEEVLLADTGVKLMQKVHQLCSGTVKFESGNSKVLDLSKLYYIQKTFKGQKIAIFYKFKAELDMLNNSSLDLAKDIDEFDNTNKSIALQFVSGRSGIKLDKADCIVALNIDFSATSYWQFRDRMTTMDRKESTIHWLFSKGGIEHAIYKSVMNKKNYTLNTFKKS